MKYHSTRSEDLVSLSHALSAGLAPDGGLYVPEAFPRLPPEAFDGCQSYHAVAARMLAPFFAEDLLKADVEDIVAEAFTFETPTRSLTDRLELLELYWGPSAAFKDYGARFLASCMSRINRAAERPLTILVATSGDTGGAVASAFEGKPNVEVVVLFPEGRVSARQQHQLTCWTGNIRTFAVRGDFDACQAMVKAAFDDPALSTALRLSSANSINIGRLLPQMTYYTYTSLVHFRATGELANFIIPTGNVGNVLAAVWARQCGLPIGKIVMATNANTTLPRLLETGELDPHPTVPTLANAMDVSKPSNLERLQHLFPEPESLQRAVRAASVDDEAIRAMLRRVEADYGLVVCPHTACALHLFESLDADHWIAVATAHPAKFDSVVEPLVGHSLDVPPALAELLARPTQLRVIDPSLAALRDQLLER